MDVVPRYTVATDITYLVMHPEIVPPFEEHSARIGAGYTLREWQELPPRDRAIEVALNRLRSKVQSIQNMEMQDHMKLKRPGRR